MAVSFETVAPPPQDKTKVFIAEKRRPHPEEPPQTAFRKA
jgi:hypothetical protein